VPTFLPTTTRATRVVATLAAATLLGACGSSTPEPATAVINGTTVPSALDGFALLHGTTLDAIAAQTCADGWAYGIDVYDWTTNPGATTDAPIPAPSTDEAFSYQPFFYIDSSSPLASADAAGPGVGDGPAGSSMIVQTGAGPGPDCSDLPDFLVVVAFTYASAKDAAAVFSTALGDEETADDGIACGSPATSSAGCWMLHTDTIWAAVLAPEGGFAPPVVDREALTDALTSVVEAAGSGSSSEP